MRLRTLKWYFPTPYIYLDYFRTKKTYKKNFTKNSLPPPHARPLWGGGWGVQGCSKLFWKFISFGWRWLPRGNVKKEPQRRCMYDRQRKLYFQMREHLQKSPSTSSPTDWLTHSRFLKNLTCPVSLDSQSLQSDIWSDIRFNIRSNIRHPIWQSMQHRIRRPISHRIRHPIWHRSWHPRSIWYTIWHLCS